MQLINNFRSAKQGITAVLLFNIAFAAGAELMRALLGTAPAPAAKPVVDSSFHAGAPVASIPTP